MKKTRLPDFAALSALALLCIAVYGPQFLGETTIIGSVDRLATFMDIRKFHVETLHMGALQGWTDRLLGGLSTWGLPHMSPLPFAYIGAMLPYRNLYAAFGWVSCGWLILAAWFSYAFVKEIVGNAAAAFVGAALYALSPYSIFLDLSVDDTYCTIALIPLVMLVIRRMSDQNLAWCYIGLSLLLGGIFFVGFLQVIAYALVLFGAYALWRGYRLRRWAVPMVFAVSVVTALLLSAPRLGTVAEELSLLYRAAGMAFIYPIEIFRLFCDGIFGNLIQEGVRINPNFNPYEGIRLCVSGFATLLIVALLVRSAEGNWFPLIPSRRDDLPFFFFFFVFVAAMLSVPPLQEILYYTFLKRSLLHGKLSIAALLPLCALVAALLQELLAGAWVNLSLPHRRWALVSSIAAGGALAWSIPALASYGTAAFSLPEGIRWNGAPYEFASAALLEIAIELVAFVGLISLALARSPSSLRRAMAVGVIGFEMVGCAFLVAYGRVNGPQTLTGRPLRAYYFLSAGPNDFKSPRPETLSAVHDRLEADAFRSVVIAPPDVFPHSIAPHIAQFWQLRLLEGYINGLPTRLLTLPWPKDVEGLRTIQFTSRDQISWPFLAALNVKYVITLNDALYFNRGRTGSDISPDEIEVEQNPLPVIPRVFWASSVVPASGPEDAATWFKDPALRGMTADNTVTTSFAEGIGTKRDYLAAGEIHADFRGDRIMIHVDPSDQPRFLVMNEMFHPKWSAYAGAQELKIYPTNAMMRGIEIPADVSDVELRFVPFVATPAAWTIAGAGAALLLGFAWLLLRFRRDAAARVAEAE